MRHSKMIGYVVGCIGFLTIGAALAKEPAQTAGPVLTTPAGCTDSPRGRTHVLRFCGEKHYWIKTGTTALPFGLTNPTEGISYAPAPNGPAQNWGGFQRY